MHISDPTVLNLVSKHHDKISLVNKITGVHEYLVPHYKDIINQDKNES